MRKKMFWLIAALILWIGIFPLAIVKIHSRIWSLEGFFRFQNYWEPDEIRSLLMILLVAGLCVLAVAFFASMGMRFFAKKRIKVSICSKEFQIVIRKKQEKAIKLLLLTALFIFTVGAWWYVIGVNEIPMQLQWHEKNTLVAHACGGVGPYQLTNSPEALEENYQKGYRVFEADMCMTADGVLVLEHDWQTYCRKTGMEYQADIFTYQDFMGEKFYDVFSPMDLPGMMELLQKHPDIYIMTDFKDAYNQNNTISAYSQIVQAAQDAGSLELLDRIIVQVYSQTFKTWVDSVYVFQNYVFTCYVAPEEEKEPDALVKYCLEENIPVITMPKEYDFAQWIPSAEKENIQIFLHTENSADEANAYIDAGISGIYTDYVLPEAIKTPAGKSS